MTDDKKCWICTVTDAETERDAQAGRSHQKCVRCGKFWIHDLASQRMRSWSERQRAQMSGWVRTQNRTGEQPYIDTKRVEVIENQPPPGVLDRVNLYLIHVVGWLSSLDDEFNTKHPALIGATYSIDAGETRVITNYLRELGYIKPVHSQGTLVTPDGFLRYEELRATQTSSDQGFVAMWFHPSMTETYENALRVGIESAGFRAMRIDRKEHSNKIDDEIIAEIRRSRFVVADFTGHRGGVYFEAGFALGLNLPVIWTCKEDDVDKLHFDVRQFNCITWSDHGDLAARLKNRIGAVIGTGPHSVLA